MKKISLGIDTSCYTTSLVAIDETLKIIFEERIMLKVKEGTVGLRQSDAFFQHVHNLPKMYRNLCEHVDISEIRNVVVSSVPRPVLGSYMPVFTSGVSFASVIADSLTIPLIHLSHQENHLYASLLDVKQDIKEFIGVHISGGTSEILKVAVSNKLEIQIIGKTLDLSFGKLIDRIGVHMGLMFPCGKELDKLAQDSNNTYMLKLSIKNNDFNISGTENKLKEFYEKDLDKSKIARTLFEYISKILIKQLENINRQYEIPTIIISGGVSANSIIRKKLKTHFGDKVIFSSIKYATDHAIGNAYYGNLVMTY